ncbi:hypothetical protein AB1484_35970, partial [Parafrankia sp. FMc6]
EARQDLWSARCGESRTPGAGSGPEKRTGRKTSTALRADFHLAELVGPAGEVTTVDIDPDITGRAARFLAATGYDRVQVLTRDGWYGAAEHAPFDAIIVTELWTSHRRGSTSWSTATTR